MNLSSFHAGRNVIILLLLMVTVFADSLANDEADSLITISWKDSTETGFVEKQIYRFLRNMHDSWVFSDPATFKIIFRKGKACQVVLTRPREATATIDVDYDIFIKDSTQLKELWIPAQRLTENNVEKIVRLVEYDSTNHTGVLFTQSLSTVEDTSLYDTTIFLHPLNESRLNAVSLPQNLTLGGLGSATGSILKVERSDQIPANYIPFRRKFDNIYFARSDTVDAIYLSDSLLDVDIDTLYGKLLEISESGTIGEDTSAFYRRSLMGDMTIEGDSSYLILERDVDQLNELFDHSGLWQVNFQGNPQDNTYYRNRGNIVMQGSEDSIYFESTPELSQIAGDPSGLWYISFADEPQESRWYFRPDGNIHISYDNQAINRLWLSTVTTHQSQESIRNGFLQIRTDPPPEGFSRFNINSLPQKWLAGVGFVVVLSTLVFVTL